MDPKDLMGLLQGINDQIEEQERGRLNVYRQWLMKDFPDIGVVEGDDEDTMHLKTSRWMALNVDHIRRFMADHKEPDHIDELVHDFCRLPEQYNSNDRIGNHVRFIPQGFGNDMRVLDLDSLYESFCQAYYRMVTDMLPGLEKREKERQAPTPPIDPHYISVN